MKLSKKLTTLAIVGAISATAAVRVALNVEQLNAVPFDNKDSAWFHFGTAATAATFVVFVRRVVVCTSTETKCYVNEWNERSIADLYSFAYYRFHFDHISEFLE